MQRTNKTKIGDNETEQLTTSLTRVVFVSASPKIANLSLRTLEPMKQYMYMATLPDRENRPCAVLMCPLARVLGAVSVRSSFFVGDEMAQKRQKSSNEDTIGDELKRLLTDLDDKQRRKRVGRLKPDSVTDFYQLCRELIDQYGAASLRSAVLVPRTSSGTNPRWINGRDYDQRYDGAATVVRYEKRRFQVERHDNAKQFKRPGTTICIQRPPTTVGSFLADQEARIELSSIEICKRTQEFCELKVTLKVKGVNS